VIGTDIGQCRRREKTRPYSK